MPSGTIGVPTGSGQKNGIVSREIMSGCGFVSLIWSLKFPIALRPDIVCALPSKTACAPWITSMNDCAGDCMRGLAARFHAYTNVCAVTGAPVENFDVLRRLNVYVLPSRETAGMPV